MLCSLSSRGETKLLLFPSVSARGELEPRVPITACECSSLFFTFLFNKPLVFKFPLLPTLVQPRESEGEETLALLLPASLTASVLSEGSVVLRGEIFGVELLLLVLDPVLIKFDRPPIMIEPDLPSSFLAPSGDSVVVFTPRLGSSGLLSGKFLCSGFGSNSTEGRGGEAGRFSTGPVT